MGKHKRFPEPKAPRMNHLAAFILIALYGHVPGAVQA